MKKTKTHALFAIANLVRKELFSGWGAMALFLAAMLLTVGAPFLVASKEDPTLIPSTRTQVACFFAWAITIFWANLRLASIGSEQRLRNLSLFWRCMGVSDFSRYLATLAPFFSVSLACNTLAGAAYFWSYLSGQQPAMVLLAAALQFAALATTVQLGLYFITLGLSAVITGPSAFFLAMCLGLYGIYGAGIVALLGGGTSNPIGGFLWAVSPQLSLGDQTTRLVFNWGSLPAQDFFAILAYCALWTAGAFLLGLGLFKEGRLSASA